MLTEIAFSQVRNLQEQEISFGSGTNLILGDNAAGKSSVLEAIHLLSLGRSFRTSHIDQVIAHGKNECWVRGRVKFDSNNAETVLGFMRIQNRNVLRIDGQDASSIAQIARLYPIQIIHPESYRLVTGGPSLRRSFMDWGCFYTYADFHQTWRNYRRTLAQYNSALKQQSNAFILKSIESELSLQGQKMNQFRQAYLSNLMSVLADVDILWPDVDFRRLEYTCGWRTDCELDAALFHARPRSLQTGSATVGPHRADLKLLHQDRAVSEVFSRGLIKRATLALMLAQIILFEKTTQARCTLMLDDFSSELDNQSMSLVAEVIKHRKSQCFITSLIGHDKLPISYDECRVFHVKHGNLNELV